MKHRIARKIVAGLLIWLAAAAMVAIWYGALPWNRWLSIIPMSILGIAAWLIFRLVRERNPEGVLDTLEVCLYLSGMAMSVAVVLALVLPM